MNYLQRSGELVDMTNITGVVPLNKTGNNDTALNDNTAQHSLGAGLPASPVGIVRSPWSSNDDSDVFEVHDPSTGALMARVQGAGKDQVDAALLDAREVFDTSWRLVSPGNRASALRHCAQLLREHADEIAEIESREVGKPYQVSRNNDIEVCIASFEFFAGQAQALHGEFFAGGPIDTYTIPEPYGVVVGIIPFNWPPIHAGAKAAAALAAGNVVILKPPEQCPFTVARIVEILQGALPAGVLRCVPGLGKTTGAHLVSSPRVDRLSFTGSPNTAKQVMHSAADNFTGALLELGGKNPFVVFNDADLDVAVPVAVEATFFNSGEACTSASRIVVESGIADEFSKRYVELVRQLVTGSPFEPGTHIGPMITAAHRDRVSSYIDIGIAEGAELAFRGDVPDDPSLAGGHWVPPIVFDHVDTKMRIAQEEIFGPVVTILRFDTYEEGISIANDTEFALVAAVFTRDDMRYRRASRDIDAGVVFVNNYNRSFLPAPFGGNRASGYGREHAAETLREYCKSKSVRVPSGNGTVPQRWHFTDK